MFKKYMDLAKINKIIAKQRKIAESNPDSGYSAIISAMLQNEAKGTYKSYPEYTRKVVNDFFAECVTKMRSTDIFRNSCIMDNKDPMEMSNDNVVICAVMLQAYICKDMTIEELKSHLNNMENAIKIFVNMKLLPERCLNDCEFDMRVA